MCHDVFRVNKWFLMTWRKMHRKWNLLWCPKSVTLKIWPMMLTTCMTTCRCLRKPSRWYLAYLSKCVAKANIQPDSANLIQRQKVRMTQWWPQVMLAANPKHNKELMCQKAMVYNWIILLVAWIQMIKLHSVVCSSALQKARFSAISATHLSSWLTMRTNSETRASFTC